MDSGENADAGAGNQRLECVSDLIQIQRAIIDSREAVAMCYRNERCCTAAIRTARC